MPAIDLDDLSTWPPEWLPFLPMPEVEALTSLSRDTLMRRYPHLIVRLSERRVAMRRGHALMLGTKVVSPEH